MTSEDKGKFIFRIPLDWYCKCTMLSPKTAILGAALWYLQGFNGYRSPFVELKLTGRTLKKFNISRHTAYRALKELSESGLIEYSHRRGAAPRVRILHDDDRSEKINRTSYLDP